MTRKKADVMVDGVGYAIRSNRPFRLICCDCGLAHRVVIAGRSPGGWFGIAVKRERKPRKHRPNAATIAYNLARYR